MNPGKGKITDDFLRFQLFQDEMQAYECVRKVRMGYVIINCKNIFNDLLNKVKKKKSVHLYCLFNNLNQ